MSEERHTPNTSAFEPEKESTASPVKRFAPLAGIVALMGTIVVAGSAIANTRTAPEIDPSAVTVEPSISKEHSDHQGPSTPVTPSSERDDDSDDVDDVSDDIQQEPAYITPQVPLTYQDWTTMTTTGTMIGTMMIGMKTGMMTTMTIKSA